MDLPLSVAADYILYAVEQEEEQAAWELWRGMYPFMVSGLIKEFIRYDEFKNKLLNRRYKYSQKSLEEIEKEMLAVVAAYKGR